MIKTRNKYKMLLESCQSRRRTIRMSNILWDQNVKYEITAVTKRKTCLINQYKSILYILDTLLDSSAKIKLICDGALLSSLRRFLGSVCHVCEWIQTSIPIVQHFFKLITIIFRFPEKKLNLLV